MIFSKGNILTDTKIETVQILPVLATFWTNKVVHDIIVHTGITTKIKKICLMKKVLVFVNYTYLGRIIGLAGILTCVSSNCVGHVGHVGPPKKQH